MTGNRAKGLRGGPRSAPFLARLSVEDPQSTGTEGAPRVTFFQDRSDGVWFANTGEYTVGRRTLEGDTTLVLSLPVTPEAVTDAERDSALEAIHRTTDGIWGGSISRDPWSCRFRLRSRPGITSTWSCATSSTSFT